MSDFHAAWARENVKAARGPERGPDGRVYTRAGDPIADLYSTPVEPHDVPVGQDMSQDRQDSDETSADTNPCKCYVCLDPPCV